MYVCIYTFRHVNIVLQGFVSFSVIGDMNYGCVAYVLLSFFDNCHFAETLCYVVEKYVRQVLAVMIYKIVFYISRLTLTCRLNVVGSC